MKFHREIVHENKEYYKKKLYEQADYAAEQISIAGQHTKQAVKVPTLRRFIQEQMGYPLEKHVYTTEDGYINSVYRIPGVKGYKAGKKNRDPKRPVVLYQHGLLDCCVGIVADQEDSIGLRLVNEGFDLWMNNSRGNRYSRDHQLIDLDTCSPEEKEEYFAFSFD